MANHSPNKDNYVEKKTWDEAMSGGTGKTPSAAAKAKDADKRAKDKGEAARNGGGDDK